ncbi:hypothetical protein [uncultured Treponema sp.]|uniref:hypothetical protein n=1 Tax=uncultured Treponema sp. TaxID=162155 RepID=UPI002612AF5E|nr:hypothetical protein [uncultured Treponema sp.]
MNMTTDFFEYYFLSSCYEQGVSEETVYKLFLEKVIADYPYEKFPCSLTISAFQKYILAKYKIEIPPTFIKSLLLKIEGHNSEFKLKKDVVTFIKEPIALQEKYKFQQKNLDDTTRKIYNQFNLHLQHNCVDKISYKDFYDTISIYFSKITNVDVKEDTELSKILISWITGIYKNKSDYEIQKYLDKLIYSWLLFSYFYSVKRSKKRLNGNTVVFDTNLIVYLLGINGKERQFFVEYLVEKLKQNGCSIQINDFSVREFRGLLSSKENPDILIFRKNNPVLFNQLLLNTEEYLISIFKRKYEIYVTINSKLTLPNSDKFLDLVSNLKNFKGFQTTHESAEHDIKLIFSTGELKKISNIYSVKKLIATSDSVLTKWFASYMKRTYESDYINLLTLYKINLIFWIESDKCISSDFLMNTWMSVSDSIDFFKNQHINRFFETLSEKYSQKNIPPENWRSVYLLLKDNLPTEREPTEDDLLIALDKISTIDAEENFELLQQVKDTSKEIEELKNEISRLKNEPKTQVIIQEKEKSFDEYAIWQIILVLAKRVFFWFIRK